MQWLKAKIYKNKVTTEMLTELNNLLLLPQHSTSVTDEFIGVWYLV